jgi:hypothetical protein
LTGIGIDIQAIDHVDTFDQTISITAVLPVNQFDVV